MFFAAKREGLWFIFITKADPYMRNLWDCLTKSKPAELFHRLTKEKSYNSKLYNLLFSENPVITKSYATVIILSVLNCWIDEAIMVLIERG